MTEERRTEDVDIPAGAHKYCPLRPGVLTPVRACLQCQYFDALECRSANAEIPFERRFSVRCTHPQRIEVFMVESDEEAKP
jgi:hypothetical protein